MKKKESALFFSYLCAHILQIAFLLLCFAIFAVILYLYDLPADPVLYAALLCAAVGLLSFILSYLRFHKQFRRLESALLNLPESRDDLPEPSGSTAVCYDEAVRMLCTKLAQSETDRRRGQEENTDYFTMWVHQIKTPISAMRLMLGEEDTPRSRALSAELFRIDRYAEMAAKMIYEALPVVREEPKNVEMREQLLVASFLAGMAFTRTYVGYVHAFAHSIGGRYGVAHGLANAVLLPHIMEYYLPVSTPRLARMAQICGISSDPDESTRARAFVESIAAMNQTGGVPERLAEFPRAEIDAVIKEAFQECHGTYPVPRYYTRPAARALLEQVCAE